MSYKAGFIGLVGMPNAGKSTFVNAFIGEKVGIVTAKPQTTRQKVVGVFSNDDTQILFVDAPGYVKSETGINKFLQDELASVLEESDALIAVLNIDEKKPERLEKIIEVVKESGKPWMVLITKNDMGLPHRVDILKAQLSEYNVPVRVVSSVKNPERLQQELLPLFREMLPASEAPLCDPEIYTTQNVRDIAAEVIREKCFEYLHQEIPYGLAVRIVKFIEDKGPTVKIFSEIVVAKENHRHIVIGTAGKSIKMIGQSSRIELEKILGRKIYLDLHVKVKKNWTSSESMMQELGYGTEQ